MDRPAKRAKLLSDDSSDGGVDADQAPATNGFRINEEYARRFEHNKKREEKHRLEEKYVTRKKEAGAEEVEDEKSDSEEDESEDDDGDLATKDVDDEIFATLKAIKDKDPRVYDSSAQFYKKFDIDEGSGNRAAKEKPVYLQDYHRQNLLAGYTGEDPLDSGPEPKTYNEEQAAMRRELVDSMHATAIGMDEEDDDGSDGEGLLTTKSRTRPDNATTTSKTRPITDEDVAEAGKDPETYLSNFMAARAWVPNETSRWQAFDSDDSEDEKKADEFEEAYNMRFEDPKTANEKLQSFARDVGKYGVRRDEKTGRQRAREREREQRDLAKKEREEERARLRKLKIDEAEEKVKKIKQAAGLRGQELNVSEWRDIIDGDFDDDMWEREMKSRFGEKYYADNEDDDEGVAKSGKLHKPKWDDDIEINDIVPDFEKEQDGPAFTLSSDEDDAADGGEAQKPRKKAKTKKDREKEKAEAKRTARRERRQIESLVDASLPLSHPSLAVNDTKAPVVGFRYRETSPTSFGLNARDILFADDGQLNSFAGLKKMAAFRDPEKKRRDKKRYSKKQRLREWRKETFGSVDGP